MIQCGSSKKCSRPKAGDGVQIWDDNKENNHLISSKRYGPKYSTTVAKDFWGQPQVVEEGCLVGLITKTMTPWVSVSSSVDYQKTIISSCFLSMFVA